MDDSGWIERRVFPLTFLVSYDDWFKWMKHWESGFINVLYKLTLADNWDVSLCVNPFLALRCTHPTLDPISASIKYAWLHRRFTNYLPRHWKVEPTLLIKVTCITHYSTPSIEKQSVCYSMLANAQVWARAQAEIILQTNMSVFMRSHPTRKCDNLPPTRPSSPPPPASSTLLFGIILGQDSVSLPNLLAVQVTITGVVMTQPGKLIVADDVSEVTAGGYAGGRENWNLKFGILNAVETWMRPVLW